MAANVVLYLSTKSENWSQCTFTFDIYVKNFLDFISGITGVF